MGDGRVIETAGLLRGLRMSGGEVLQAEQRQCETILYPHLLEQMGQINLHGAFGDLEGGSDLLVLQAVGHQCDELSFALTQLRRRMFSGFWFGVWAQAR